MSQTFETLVFDVLCKDNVDNWEQSILKLLVKAGYKEEDLVIVRPDADKKLNRYTSRLHWQVITCDTQRRAKHWAWPDNPNTGSPLFWDELRKLPTYQGGCGSTWHANAKWPGKKTYHYQFSTGFTFIENGK